MALRKKAGQQEARLRRQCEQPRAGKGEGMALTLYTGGSGAGKTHAVFERIIEESMREPGRRFIVLVPEQFTMQTQKMLVRQHPRHGILNIDVLSFNRLAYRVFSETGEESEEMLEEIGKTFMLEKIALDLKKQLPYYGATLARPQNLAEMKALISELMLYDVSPEQLAGAVTAEEKAKSSPFAMKISDTAHVYAEFRERLAGTYMTAEEVPDRLVDIVDRSELVRDSVIALDGFTGFTPVQLKLIGKLMDLVKDMYVTVTLDQYEQPFGPYRKTGLFALSHTTTQALKKLAEEHHVPVAKPVFIPENEHSRHAGSLELQFLEASMFRDRRHGHWQEEPHDVRVFAAQNPRKEIEETALEISRLVRGEGYRYRDIAVVTGDLASYGDYVRQVFSEWNIPYFLDQKRALVSNPFIEYLRAAMQACAEDYSYEGIFRMLKSGMTDFTADEIEHLENYVRGCGIRGKKKWRTRFIRSYQGEDPGEVPLLDGVRERLLELLDPLADAFGRRGGTVREKSEAVYDFCVRTHAEEKLRARTKWFDENDRPDLAREYDQVYPYVCHFLDKLTAVLGEEKISMKNYQALLEAGFAEARVAIIPPGSDQVMVGDVERSRIGDVKVLFFVGVNEGVIPKMVRGGGTLNDADRSTLSDREITLKPTARENLYIERFYLYMTLAKPSRKLILMYSAANMAGEVMKPAYLIGAVRRLFPKLEERHAQTDIRQRFERPETGVRLVTEGLESIDTKAVTPEFLELFSWYRRQPVYARKMDILLEAAGRRKPKDRIGRAAAEALYGKNLHNSASRLEQFCACRFAHFLKYGLRLKERAEFLFNPMDLGTVMHRSLELFAGSAGPDREKWQHFAEDNELRNGRASDSMRQAVAESGSDVLHDTARNEYQIRRMDRLMSATAWAQTEQIVAGDFVPAGMETVFSGNEDIEAARISLPGGAELTLTGRIDRIDICDEDGVTLVRVIDYKTGRKEFSLRDVYYGLQLQLVIYMEAALELLRKQGKHPVPAGIFYYRVMDPVVAYQPGETGSELAKRILKELIPSGIVIGDEKTAEHFDHALKESGTGSDVVPVKRTKKGISKTSHMISAGDYGTVSTYVRRKVMDAGCAILSGSAEINPYATADLKDTACQFCEYRGICGFDRRIPGYQYRLIDKMSQDDAVLRMEGEDDGDQLDK